MPERVSDFDEPIHEWFNLTYAHYLVLPRSVLQSMPKDWQRRFVQCLEELDQTIDWRPTGRLQYRIALHQLVDVWDDERGDFVDTWGPEVDDPLMDYNRGRRVVPHKEPPSS